MEEIILKTEIKSYKFIENNNKYLVIKELNGKKNKENDGIIIFKKHLKSLYNIFEKFSKHLTSNYHSREYLSWNKVKEIILKRDNNKCRICDKYVYDKGQTHHIIERNKGGTNLSSNLITVCGKCHMLLSPVPKFAINKAFQIPKEKIDYFMYKAKKKEKQIKKELSFKRSKFPYENYETSYFNYNFQINKTVDNTYILIVKQESKVFNNHDLRRIVIFKENINTFNAVLNKKLNKSHKNKKTYNLKEIRQKYPNAYTKWTEKEDELLIKKYKSGYKIKELVKDLGRQPGAINSRIKKLT